MYVVLNRNGPFDQIPLDCSNHARNETELNTTRYRHVVIHLYIFMLSVRNSWNRHVHVYMDMFPSPACGWGRVAANVGRGHCTSAGVQPTRLHVCSPVADLRTPLT